jgi:hypothetical protein
MTVPDPVPPDPRDEDDDEEIFDAWSYRCDIGQVK